VNPSQNGCQVFRRERRAEESVQDHDGAYD
jgi:hypothetical protein